MFSKALILIALSALAVNAQSDTGTPTGTDSAAVPTSTASIPPCVLNCTTTAATQAKCAGISDLTCVCTNQAFQAAALSCLQAQCTQDDQVAANALQSTLCASISATGTVSGSPTTPASGNATSTETGSEGSTSEDSGSGSPTATAPGGSSTTGAPLTSLSTSAVSSAASAASSAVSPSSAASVLKPFGFGTTHAVGAVGVALAMVAGAATLF